MKKTIIILVAVLLGCLVASCKKDVITPDTPSQPERPAQAVNITYDEISTDHFTASFTKADSCISYHVMAAEPGTTEMYLPMFGFNTIEEAVADWGIEYNRDTTYTWDDMTPNSQYVVYVLAHCTNGDILITDTITTTVLGGHGTSSISVSVSDIASTQATTTATPNDQTALFKDFVITKEYFELIGQDSAISLLKEDYYDHYSTDKWTWLSLTPNTDYYFMAIGQNIDGVWGEMSKVAFSTTSK